MVRPALTSIIFLACGFQLRCQQLLSPQDSDYQIAAKVYSKLIQAIGDLRKEAPELKVFRGRKYIAKYVPDSYGIDAKKIQVRTPPVIKLDQQVIRICEDFGKLRDDALAYLLGHELAHFYQGHGNSLAGFSDHPAGFMNVEIGRQFGDSLRGVLLPGMDKLFALQNRKLAEAQADYYAGFYTTYAGYSSLNLARDVLTKVISVYIPDSTKWETAFREYPDLRWRKEISDVTKSQLISKVLPVFEVSRYLVLAGKLEGAEAALEYMIEAAQFQSAEIYNNLGAIQLLRAIELDTERSKWKYAVLLEEKSVLDNLAVIRSGVDLTQQRNTLLRKAIDNLQRSRAFNPDHKPSWLNLATAYHFLGENEMALGHLSILEKINGATEDARFNSYVLNLKGVIRARTGRKEDTKLARTIFSKASQNYRGAGENLKTLQGLKTNTPGNLSQPVDILINGRTQAECRDDRREYNGVPLFGKSNGLQIIIYSWGRSFLINNSTLHFRVDILNTETKLTYGSSSLDEGMPAPAEAREAEPRFSQHDYRIITTDLFFIKDALGKVRTRLIFEK